MNKLLPIIFLFSCGTSQAEIKESGLPKWELGLGPAMISYPDYPGSNEQNNLALPIPYFIYRGKGFSINNKELIKPFFTNNKFELDLSASGNIPVSSKENHKRSGMNDLDGSIGIGPVLKYTLFQNQDNTVKLELPLEAIVASDFKSIHSEGWITKPGVRYSYKKKYSSTRHIELTAGISAQYASSEYHSYLYGVPSQYVSNNRPFYQAAEGFSGVNHTIGLSYHFDNFWFGAFWHGFDLSQAVYKDSPLIDNQFSNTFGFTFTWNFLQSQEKVYGYE